MSSFVPKPSPLSHTHIQVSDSLRVLQAIKKQIRPQEGLVTRLISMSAKYILCGKEERERERERLGVVCGKEERERERVGVVCGKEERERERGGE